MSAPTAGTDRARTDEGVVAVPPSTPTDGAERSAAANLRRLVGDVQRGGQVSIIVYNEANGPYCIVTGLGAQAGGYSTVDEALAAWLEARDEYDTKVQD